MSLSWNKETDTWVRTPYTPEQEAFWRERAFFDARCREASVLANERQKYKPKEERLADAKRLLSLHRHIDFIVTVTNLTHAEVESLRDAN